MRRKLRHQQAFTVIELLIVISVIVILAGILIMGGKAVIGGSKNRQTRVALQSLQGMLANLDAATRLKNQPAGWLWYQSQQSKNVVDPASPPYDSWNLDFWKIPNRGNIAATTGGPIIPPGATAPPDALDAPGLVNSEGPDDVVAMRNFSDAVLNTSVAMSLLLAQPANRDAVGKMQPNQLFVPEITDTPPPTLPAPGGDGWLGFSPDTTRPISYPPGAHVRYKGAYFVCTAIGGTTAKPTLNSKTAPWVDETTSGRSYPVLLDGWGNPIIFVPASGLRVRLPNNKKDYDVNDPTQNFIVTAPDNRPFFASAGPDGDFSKGDDNIYSYEQ